MERLLLGKGSRFPAPTKRTLGKAPSIANTDSSSGPARPHARSVLGCNSPASRWNTWNCRPAAPQGSDVPQPTHQPALAGTFIELQKWPWCFATLFFFLLPLLEARRSLTA